MYSLMQEERNMISPNNGSYSINVAAGGRLEPYWASIPVHKDERVYQILESLRIGNLAPGDRRGFKFDPFAAEKKNRSAIMEVIREIPYNANPYPATLNSFITPK